MDKLLSNARSLMLASLNEDQEPHASYAPFLMMDKRFYVFLSALAEHTRNLINHPRCHILVIQDEADAKNVFARERLSVACQAVVVDRNTSRFPVIMQAMREHLGPTMEMLASLPDFQLFELQPSHGVHVSGFAQARPVQFNADWQPQSE